MSRSDSEYLPPSGFDLATVGERLPQPLHLGAETTDGGRRGFYDTFDERLRAKGLRLIEEDGLLRLLDADGREVGAATAPSVGASVYPADLEPGGLRDRLAPVCGVRVLLRTAQVDSSRRIRPVLDDEQKTVARLVAETAVLADGPRADDRLRPRLHVVGVRGYDKEVSRLRGVLERELGLTPASETF